MIRRPRDGSRFPRTWRRGVVALGALAAVACEPAARADTSAVAGARDTAVVTEAFITAFDSADNVDSPAVWHADGTHWLLATAKTTDVVLVNDAATGAPVRRIGGSGTARGKLERPNGILAIDSLLFVVERDNHRVQIFRLPAFTSLGMFGDSVLRLPYGIAVYRDGANGYVAYVTDN